MALRSTVRFMISKELSVPLMTFLTVEQARTLKAHSLFGSLPLSVFIFHSDVFFSVSASVTVGGTSPTGYMLSLWSRAEPRCLRALMW